MYFRPISLIYRVYFYSILEESDEFSCFVLEKNFAFLAVFLFQEEKGEP